MNLTNNIGATNYSSFAFKGGNIKLKNCYEKKTFENINDSFNSQNKQDKKDAIKEIATKMLAIIQKKEPKTIHFNDAYKMYLDSEFKKGQEIYKSTVDMYLKDIDTAIEMGKSKEETDKLFAALEDYIAKNGHYGT